MSTPRSQFGPGAVNFDETHDFMITGGPCWPTLAEDLRSAATYLEMLDGFYHPEMGTFVAGQFPAALRDRAETIEADERLLRDIQITKAQHRARRLRRLRPAAALAFAVLDRASHSSDWLARKAADLDRIYDFSGDRY